MVTRRSAFLLAFLTAGAILIAAVGMRMALASPDGSEIETNNTCVTAQNQGAVALPFSFRGAWTPRPQSPMSTTSSSPAPPVPGGRPTWKAPLPDRAPCLIPLGLFDSACNLIARNYELSWRMGHLAFTVPADGVLILAASSADDADFTGGGGSAGSYLLTISPEAYTVSVSGRVVDGKTGVPVPSGPRTTAASGPSCAVRRGAGRLVHGNRGPAVPGCQRDVRVHIHPGQTTPAGALPGPCRRRK